jgi:hypothetical protein
MTNYYMRVSGDDSDDGLSVEDAWASLSHALDTLSAGDTLYIGPGTYRHIENVRGPIAGTIGDPIVFFGDYLGEHTGDPYGPVCLTSQWADWGNIRYDWLINWDGDTKYIEFYNLVFLGGQSGASEAVVHLGETNGAYGMDGVVFEDCMFFSKGNDGQRDGNSLILNYGDGDTPVGNGARIRRCFFGDNLILESDDNAVANFDIDVLIESCAFTKHGHIIGGAAAGTFSYKNITIRNCSALNNETGSWFVDFNYPKDPTNTMEMHGLLMEAGGIFGSSVGTASCLIHYCQTQDISANAIDLVEGVNVLATPDTGSQPRGTLFGYEVNRMYEKWFQVKPYSPWEPVDFLGQKSVVVGGANPDQVPTLDYYGRPFEGNRDKSYVFAGWYNGDFISTIWDVLYTWQDPDGVWAGEDEINESLSFLEARTAVNGSIAANFLHIEKPSVNISDNQNIQNVWIRPFINLDGIGCTLNFNFYTLNENEDLGGFSIVQDDAYEEHWRDLIMIPNTPVGGWTPTHLRNLECRMWQTGGGDVQIQRLLVYMDTADHDSGAVASRGNLEIETGVVLDGDQSLKITRGGFYQTQVPVVADTEITVSAYTRYDSNYSGDLPTIEVFNIPGGIAEQTDVTLAPVDTWNGVGVTFTPTQNGFVTVRLVSHDTSPDGITYFDNLTWS